MVSLDGKPSIRVPAVKAVAEALRRNPFLAEARRQPAKAAIFYNRETAIINNLEGSRFQHRGEIFNEKIWAMPPDKVIDLIKERWRRCV